METSAVFRTRTGSLRRITLKQFRRSHTSRIVVSALLLLQVTVSRPAHAQSGEIEILAVTSGASFTQGIPNSGSIASIFCTGLQVDGIVAAQGLPLPRILGGIRVTVGGAEAPIFAVANLDGYQQINIQVPLETRTVHVPEWGLPAADVVVEQEGRRGERRWWWGVYTWPPFKSPGEFFRIEGTNWGIFQHAADDSLVTPENPARPGETLITYLTGMELTNPVVPTGEPAPEEPPAAIAHTAPDPRCPQCGYNDYYLKFDLDYETGDKSFDGNKDARAIFVGLTPRLVGVNQINFTLPSVLPSGTRNVTLVRSYKAPMFGLASVEVSTPVQLAVE